MESLEEDSTPRWDLNYESLAGNLRPLGNPTRLRLLNFLTTPRYLEEIASFLRVNRFAAKKHVDALVKAGFLTKQPAKRERGLVVEYAIAADHLFELFDSMRALGTLRPLDANAPPTSQTRVAQTDPRAPAQRTPRARLVLVYGIELGRTYGIDLTSTPSKILVGRDPECAVRLGQDPYISGRHAVIERKAGQTMVTDLFSRNGTSLDWRPLPAGQSTSLENGAILGVGKSLLVYRA